VVCVTVAGFRGIFASLGVWPADLAQRRVRFAVVFPAAPGFANARTRLADMWARVLRFRIPCVVTVCGLSERVLFYLQVQMARIVMSLACLQSV